MSKIFRCLLCLFLAGCSVSEGQYAFVSDRPLKLSSLTGKGGTPVSWTQALSRQHVVTLVPLSEAPSPQAAVALILREYKGDYMTNVNIRLTGVQLMPLYRYRSWRISGTVIRLQHP
jgi:hypothetical protein